MPNNNVAIISLMAKFDEKSIEDAAKKLGKTTEEALNDIDMTKFDQGLLKKLDDTLKTIEKKLKGVNLSSYMTDAFVSLSSKKDIEEKTKDLQKFIDNISNLSKSLSGLNPNSLNSLSNTKQLDAVIAKQEKILAKEQEIAQKREQLEGTAKNVSKQKRSVNTISKNYLVSDFEKSSESLKKLFNTENGLDKVQEKSIDNLSKMLTLYSDMEKIEPKKGTTEAIKYSTDLLTVVKEIKETASKIDLFTGGKSSKFISDNFDSINKVSEYNVKLSQQEYVKNELKSLNAQKSKLEKSLADYIADTVRKNLQKNSNEADRVIDKATQKADKLQQKIDSLKGNTDSGKPIITNIVDESQVKSLEEIEDRLYEIYDKDSDGKATNNELKEFIQLYKQYEQLISQQSDYKFNTDFKEEYEYIVDSSSALKKYADSIQIAVDERKKMVTIDNSDSSEQEKQLQEQEQQAEKAIITENELSTTKKESAKDFRQDLDITREQIDNLSNKLSNLEGNSFSSLTEQINGVTVAISELKDKLQSVYELVDKLNDKDLNWSELQFHQGNLEDIKNTRSRDDFGDMVSGLLYGGYLTRGYGYGVGGTGLYTARNIDEFSDFGKKANGTQSIFGYAIDWSKYPDAFKPETIESAMKIHEFLSNLQAFCIKLGSGFDKFDEKLGDIDTQKLYSDYQSIFKNAKLDFEEFSNFINEMSNLVKTAGTVDKDHFSSISEELSTSDNISARFMKKNGYSGINVSGFKEFDNVDIGSVLYDIRDGAIVKRFETLYDLMNFANQQTEEINKIAEAKKNNQSLNSGEIESEINEIKNEIIELNKTKEQLLNEINEIQSNFTNKTNTSNGTEDTIQNSSATDAKPEAQGMEQIEKATEEAAQAKKDFATANEGVQSSIDDSENPLKLEAELMAQIAKSAREAADAKKEFVEANKQVRDSAKKGNNDLANSHSGSAETSGNKNHQQKSNKDDNKLIQEQIKNLQKLSAEKQKAAESERKSTVNQASKDQLEAWKQIQRIRKEISNTSNSKIIEQLNQEKQTYQEQYLAATKILKNNSDLYNSEQRLNELKKISLSTTKQIESSQQTQLNGYDQKLSSYNSKVGNYDATINKFDNGGWTSSEYLEKVQKAKDILLEYEKEVNNLKNNPELVSKESLTNVENLGKEFENVTSEIKNMSASQKGYSLVSGQKELDKIRQILKENSAMSSDAKAKIKAYYKEIESGNPSMSLDKIHGEIMKIVNAEAEAGRAGKRMWDAIKEKAWYGVASTIGTYFGLNDIIRYGGEVVQTVTDLNTQITELAKVSEQTSKQIYADFDSYADIAKEVRGTISDTISATADWSKNGYSIPDAKQLAEVSQLYKNVGDGINIDEANESLISTLKGFQLAADQAEHIVDVFNEVSNNEAISSAGIGESLQRSAASFNAANTSLEKSVALVTATNSVLQDPEKVGNMWRTVSARLRGSETELKEMGEDTDGLVESTSKLQALVKGITGFDIMKDKDTYKDIYDIVLGIGEKWQELSDIDRASLLEALASKQQSNALAAALSNIDILKKSYEEATNAEGSAREENEEYAKSIQASIDLTQAKLEELSNNLLSSDFLKGAIDAGGKLIDILDGIVKSGNTIPTVLTAIGAALSFKNVGGSKMYDLICLNSQQ